ncbi:hypothetical protein BDZ94DRAFT_1256353, partial [Collybia nuda]
MAASIRAISPDVDRTPHRQSWGNLLSMCWTGLACSQCCYAVSAKSPAPVLVEICRSPDVNSPRAATLR